MYNLHSQTGHNLALQFANNNEDLENIYSKVLDSPDFIQVDLVDKTVYENALEVNISK